LGGSGLLSDQKQKQWHVIFSFSFVLAKAEEEDLDHPLPRLDEKPDFFAEHWLTPKSF